jgi:hypothetical protein
LACHLDQPRQILVLKLDAKINILRRPGKAVQYARQSAADDIAYTRLIQGSQKPGQVGRFGRSLDVHAVRIVAARGEIKLILGTSAPLRCEPERVSG